MAAAEGVEAGQLLARPCPKLHHASTNPEASHSVVSLASGEGATWLDFGLQPDLRNEGSANPSILDVFFGTQRFQGECE